MGTMYIVGHYAGGTDEEPNGPRVRASHAHPVTSTPTPTSTPARHPACPSARLLSRPPSCSPALMHTRGPHPPRVGRRQ